jgi:ppGpp synthetase/RelA/SpoT-type nucleotidyltranferase
MDALKWYIENRPVYKHLANKIESILIEILELEKISYHMIQSRAKEIESFNKKISGDKYKDPIKEIHDYAGVRIITYVEDEVGKVCNKIESLFKIDWENSSDKSDFLGVDKVGYKSVHYVAYLKSDRLKLPENSQFKERCFEIQVRTILQHAWAEIEHDRNYKFSGVLPDAIQRRFKLLAGSLESADREFNSISNEIDHIANEVKSETQKGNFDILLNSTSFSEYFKNRFTKIMKNHEIRDLTEKIIVEELNLYGIENLKDLDNIIPEDFENQLTKSSDNRKDISAVAIIRMILIINDYDNYFTNANLQKWNAWTPTDEWKSIYDFYNVDWNEINKKYDIVFSDIQA